MDDASTDSTPQIAQEVGVRTLRVEHRKISAVRNEGARAACGEVLFFVDADTQGCIGRNQVVRWHLDPA